MFLQTLLHETQLPPPLPRPKNQQLNNSTTYLVILQQSQVLNREKP